MARLDRCVLCDLQGVEIHGKPGELRTDCPVCGSWRCSSLLYDVIEAAQKPALRIAARREHDQGRALSLDTHNVGDIARRHSNLSLSVKRDSVLRAIRVASQGVYGHVVGLAYGKDYSQHWCGSPREMELVAQLLNESGLTKRASDNQYSLSPSGWEATEPASGRAEPGTCFVAMAFEASLEAAYTEAIRPAVEDDCKLRVIRVDKVEHNGSINDLILVELHRAEVIVADFTMPRQGVYFEAGIGLGEGREVVFTCREDTFDSGRGVHFDTRPMNHVLWTNPVDFRAKLANRLKLTVPSLRVK